MTFATLETLNDLARRAEQDETACRREAEQRIAALSAARTFAYRRANFFKSLFARAAAIETVEERPAGVLALATEMSHWNTGRSAYADVCAALAPVVAAICDEVAGGEAPRATEAMAAFELWYRGRFNAEFLDLLAEAQHEFISVVDF